MRIFLLIVAATLGVACGSAGGAAGDAGGVDTLPSDTPSPSDLDTLADTADLPQKELPGADTGDGELAGLDTAGPDTTLQCQDHHDCLYLEEDGNLCDGGWFCEFGTCVERKTPVYCNENNLSTEERRCNTLRCDPEAGVCKKSFKPGGTECDDKDACTTDDYCLDGACVGDRKVCKTTNPCSPASCDTKTGNCVEAPLGEGEGCDDGSLCTDSDQCTGGECLGTAKVCSGAPQCRKASCDALTGECVFLPEGDLDPCNDGDKCTQMDLCKQGECQGIPVECFASGLCLRAFCDGATGDCAEVPLEVDSPCEDGDFCTENDKCDHAGVCQSGTPMDCGTGDVCRVGECDEGQNKCVVTNVTLGTPCSDFDLCTIGDYCQAGICVASPKTCPVTDARCQQGLCNPYTGNCSVQNSGNGTGCNDGNLCTINDNCQNGGCVASPKPCSPSGQCKTNARCNGANGACIEDNKNNGTPCNDGNGNTENDNCQNGVCKGTPKD